MNADEARAALAESASWRKASYSQGESACVEIAEAGGWIGVRDSKLGDASPILTFTPAEFAAFRNGVKTGEFDEL